MADGKTDTDTDKDPTLVERWLQDQQQWQRTILTYVDSMMKNDEFVVHLGNAMRGSLLAGKPYPTAPAPGAPAEDAPADDRLDQVLHALHQLQGQLNDLTMTLNEIRDRLSGADPRPFALAPPPAPRPKRRARTATKAKAPEVEKAPRGEG